MANTARRITEPPPTCSMKPMDAAAATGSATSAALCRTFMFLPLRPGNTASRRYCTPNQHDAGALSRAPTGAAGAHVPQGAHLLRNRGFAVDDDRVGLV